MFEVVEITYLPSCPIENCGSNSNDPVGTCNSIHEDVNVFTILGNSVIIVLELDSTWSITFMSVGWFFSNPKENVGESNKFSRGSLLNDDDITVGSLPKGSVVLALILNLIIEAELYFCTKESGVNDVTWFSIKLCVWVENNELVKPNNRLEVNSWYPLSEPYPDKLPNEALSTSTKMSSVFITFSEPVTTKYNLLLVSTEE